MKSLSHNVSLVLAALALIVCAGCTAQVGDACETDADCGQALRCDRSQPDGYCTVNACAVNGCPEESACIQFQDESTFCMRRCDTTSDCRDGYVCVGNYGDTAFCNAVPLPAVTAP